MSRRAPSPTRRDGETRRTTERGETLPTHRPPRDWRAVAPLAGDIRGRMGRPRPTGE
jgi:hypothetical protein